MKIKIENQLGLIFAVDTGMKTALYNDTENFFNQNALWLIANNVKTTPDDIERHKRYIKEFSKEDDNKNYLITGPAQSVIEKSKLPEKWDARILINMERGKRTFLLGLNRFYRCFFETDDQIVVLEYKAQPKLDNLLTIAVDYVIFRVLISKGLIVTNGAESLRESAEFFIKMVSFIDLTQLEIIQLGPGKSIGTRKIDKFKNETDGTIIIVDSAWNKMYTKDSIHIDPYLRWQHYGRANSLGRWQWIGIEQSGFNRGYRRLSTKERELTK